MKRLLNFLHTLSFRIAFVLLLPLIIPAACLSILVDRCLIEKMPNTAGRIVSQMVAPWMILLYLVVAFALAVPHCDSAT